MDNTSLVALALAGALHGASTHAAEPTPATAVIDPGLDRLTMINILRPSEADQDEVVRLLRSGLEEVMSKQPGFIDASVHRSADNEYVVVYAHWDDIESLRAAGAVVMSGGAPDMANAYRLGQADYHPYVVEAVITP